MKDFFPESLGQKHGCTFYMGAHHTQQNTVLSVAGVGAQKHRSLRMASPQDGLTEKSNVLIHAMSATQTTELGV